MKRSVRNQRQICLFTEAGEVVHQRIQTQRQRFAVVFAERPTARILIEASTDEPVLPSSPPEQPRWRGGSE